jgi:hypothetical protein
MIEGSYPPWRVEEKAEHTKKGRIFSEYLLELM